MSIKSSSPTPLVQAVDIVREFGGVTAVAGMNLEIHHGEVVTLIGPNGAGKTTLFNILSGVDKPTSGELFFEGGRVTNTPSWKMASIGIGRTFQNIRLFESLTVLENIALPRQKPSPFSKIALEEVEDLLNRMNLLPVAEQKAALLSYGIRRKVELARALATKPKLILLDEPTAGMNTVEAMELVDIVRELADDGISIMLIEHNLQVAMQAADRVVVMHLGEKLAEGSPEKIRKDARVIEAYLGEA